MAKNQRVTATGYFPTTPAEWSAVGAVVGAGVNAAKTGLELMKSRSKTASPLDVSVLQSEPGSSTYTLAFGLKNCTAHGLYVEELILLEPGAKVSSIRLADYSVPKAHIEFGRTSGSSGSGTAFVPKLIAPGEIFRLTIGVQSDAKLWFDTATLGIARARLSALHENTTRHVEWPFRIRHRRASHN